MRPPAGHTVKKNGKKRANRAMSDIGDSQAEEGDSTSESENGAEVVNGPAESAPVVSRPRRAAAPTSLNYDDIEPSGFRDIPDWHGKTAKHGKYVTKRNKMNGRSGGGLVDLSLPAAGESTLGEFRSVQKDGAHKEIDKEEGRRKAKDRQSSYGALAPEDVVASEEPASNACKICGRCEYSIEFCEDTVFQCECCLDEFHAGCLRRRYGLTLDECSLCLLSLCYAPLGHGASYRSLAASATCDSFCERALFAFPA